MILNAQEEGIPFDSKGKIFKVTPDLEQNLKLYSGNGKFNDAELYKESDSTYILEIHYTLDNKQYRDRKPLSLDEKEAISKKLEGVIVKIPESSDAMEGRSLLLGSCLGYGLSLYALSIVSIANPSDPYTGTGLYLLTAGGSFFIPYLLTENTPVSYGQANLVRHGLSYGYLHGLLFWGALSNESFDLFTNNESNSRRYMAFGTLFGLSEAIASYNVVKNLNISNGTANLIKIYDNFGLIAGVELANQFEPNNGRPFTSLALAGGISGIALGYYFDKDNSISEGDAEIIGTSAYLGAYLPLGFVKLFDPKKSWAYTTPSLICGIAGLYIGHQLIKDYDFSFSQGYLTRIGTYAGGLMGLGLSYMIAQDNSSALLIGSYLGAQLAFYGLYKMDIKSLKSEALNKFDFKFHPENIFLSRSVKSDNPYIQSMFPIATLSYKLD